LAHLAYAFALFSEEPEWLRWAHQCPLDWFKFRLCCHWNTYKEIKSYNHRTKQGWTYHSKPL